MINSTKQLFQVLALMFAVCSTGCAAATPLCESQALRGLGSWEKQMVREGHRWGRYFDPENGIGDRDKLVNEFYDSAYSFYQISDYVGEQQPWSTYALWASNVYLKTYVIPNDYKTAGWRRSSYGLFERMSREGDIDVEQLEWLRDRPAFSKVREGRGQGGAEHRSRAIALAVESNIVAEKAGSDRVLEDGRTRFESFIPWMGSHLYEWRSGNYRGYYNQGRARFSPFMFGITAHALIDYVEWERENDRDPQIFWPRSFPIDYGPRLDPDAPVMEWESITDALADVAIWAVDEAMHENGERMWQKDVFLYESIHSADVAYGLNLLIAHVYAWLWKETGDERFLRIGDTIFSSGAKSGATHTGKHFNQQYRYAFDFIKWRNEGFERHCGSSQSEALSTKAAR